MRPNVANLHSARIANSNAYVSNGTNGLHYADANKFVRDRSNDSNVERVDDDGKYLCYNYNQYDYLWNRCGKQSICRCRVIIAGLHCSSSEYHRTCSWSLLHCFDS